MFDCYDCQPPQLPPYVTYFFWEGLPNPRLRIKTEIQREIDGLADDLTILLSQTESLILVKPDKKRPETHR